jgi:hypothetical protein
MIYDHRKYIDQINIARYITGIKITFNLLIYRLYFIFLT